MGYTAFITRNRSYPFTRQDTGNPILAAEFLAIVDADPTLSVHSDNPNRVTWQGSEVPILYSAEYGDVGHSDPVPPVVEKRIDLSARLHAFVRGSDGEFWLSGTEVEWPDHPDFNPNIE